jgi:hypothetical protein
MSGNVSNIIPVVKRKTSRYSGSRRASVLIFVCCFIFLGSSSAPAFNETYWTLDGELPPDLMFDGTTGTITGTPLPMHMEYIFLK